MEWTVGPLIIYLGGEKFYCQTHAYVFQWIWAGSVGHVRCPECKRLSGDA